MRVRVVHQGEVSTIPLLSEAYSDAHLNLGTLDKDITAAEKKLQRAVNRFDKILKVKLDLNTTEARRKLDLIGKAADRVKAKIASPISFQVEADLTKAKIEAAAGKAAIDDALGDVQVDVDVDDDAAVRSLAGLQARMDDLTSRIGQIDVTLDDGNIQGQLDEIRSQIRSVQDSTLGVRLDVDDAVGLAQLQALQAELARLDGETVAVTLDLDAAAATGDLVAFRTLAESLRERILVDVDADVRPDGLEAMRAKIEGLTDGFYQINVDVDDNLARLNLEELQRLVDQLNTMRADIGVGLDGDERTKAQLATLNAQLKLLDKRVIRFDVDADGISQARIDIDRLSKTSLAQLKRRLDELTRGVQIVKLDTNADRARANLATLRAELQRVIGDTLTIPIDVDDGFARAQLAALTAQAQRLDGDAIQLDVDIDGVAAAMAQMGGLLTVAEALDGKDIDIGSDGLKGLTVSAEAAASAVNNLSGIGGSLGGLGKVGGIVGLVAALGPLVPGLIGAAGGFLAMGIGAGAAVGGLAALAVLTDPAAKKVLGDYFTTFKSGVQQAFGPTTLALVTKFGPQFFGALDTLVKSVASQAPALLFPIAESLTSLTASIGPSLAPLAGPIGAGIASLVDGFAKFVPLLSQITLELTGPFFDALNGLVDLIFSTAQSATPIWVGFLNAIGSGARSLIGPLNDFTESFRSIFDFGAGPNPVAELLGQAGPIIADFGLGLLEVFAGIADAVSSIGLDNLLNLVVLLSGPIGTLVLVVTNLKGAFEAVEPALSGLAPIAARVGDIIGTVFEGVLTAVTAFIAGVDFGGLASGLAPLLNIGQALADVFLVVLPPVAGVLGAVIGNVNVLLPLLGALAALRLADTFASWGSGLMSFASTISSGVAGVFQSLQQSIRGVTMGTATIGQAVGGIGSSISSGVGSAVSAIGSMNLAIAGIGIAIGGALAAYNAWSTNIKRVEDETRQLTDALLEQAGGVLPTLATQFREILDTRGGFAEAFSKSGISVTGITEIVNATPGAIDAVRSLKDEFTKGGSNEASLNIFRERLNEIPAAIRPVIENLLDLNDAGILTSGDFDKILDAMTDLDTNAMGAAQSIAFNSDQLRQLIPNAQRTQQVLKDLSIAGATDAGLSDQRAALQRLVKEFPQLAKSIGITEASVAALTEETAAGTIGLNRYGAAAKALPKGLAAASAGVANLMDKIRGGTITTGSGILAAAKEARAAADEVSDIDTGIDIGSFFSIPDETVDKAVSQAQKIHDGVKEFLGYGSLSEFVDGSERSLVRSLDRLVMSLAQKGENIRRLKIIDQMGFTDLAVQLASITDPGTLGKFLDQLFSAGVNEMAIQNGRLANQKNAIVANMSGLSPALAAALGQGLDEAEQKVQDGSDSINVALDKLVSGIQLKAQNLQRLNQLQAQGFGSLAAELVTLNTDPKALKAALDQLAAQGTAGLAAANARIQGAQAAYVATFNATDGLVAKALGKNDQTKAALDEQAVTLTEAIRINGEQIALATERVTRTAFLRAMNLDAIADFLNKEGISDAQFKAWFDEATAGGLESLTNFNASLQSQTDTAVSTLADLQRRLTAEGMKEPGGWWKVPFGLSGAGGIASGVQSQVDAVIGAAGAAEPQLNSAGQAMGGAVVDGFSTGLNAGTSGGSWLPWNASSGVVPPEATAATQFGTIGASYGAAVITGFQEALAGVDSSAALQDVLVKLAESTSGFRTVGFTYGAAVTEGIANGIKSPTSGPADALVPQIELLAASAPAFRIPGLDMGTAVVDGIIAALQSSAAGVAAAASVMGYTLLGGTESFLQSGLFLGATFPQGIVLGLTDGLSGVTEAALAAGAPVGAAAALLAPSYAQAGIGLGRWFNLGIIVGLQAGLPVDQLQDTLDAFVATGSSTFGMAGATVATSFLDGFKAGADPIPNEAMAVGVVMGISYSSGVQAGLTDGFSRIVIPTDRLRADAQFFGVGRFSGVALADGIQKGMLDRVPMLQTTATLIALAIQNTINQVLGINSPSTVGITIGGFVVEGIAKGLRDAVPLVDSAATTLAARTSAAVASSLAPSTILGAGFAAAVADGMVGSQGLVADAAALLGDAASIGFRPQVNVPVGPSVAVANPQLAAVAAERTALDLLAAERTAAAAQGVGTVGSTEAVALLQQILTAIRSIDATTDPTVLVLLEQVLASMAAAPESPAEREAVASYIKAMS